MHKRTIHAYQVCRMILWSLLDFRMYAYTYRHNHYSVEIQHLITYSSQDADGYNFFSPVSSFIHCGLTLSNRLELNRISNTRAMCMGIDVNVRYEEKIKLKL